MGEARRVTAKAKCCGNCKKFSRPGSVQSETEYGWCNAIDPWFGNMGQPRVTITDICPDAVDFHAAAERAAKQS